MPRTNSGAVQSILGRDYDTLGAPSLTPYIDTASAVVDRVVACAAARGDALSLSEAELVERWLSAHFYGQSDKPYASSSTSGASGSFHGQTRMYLESTLYGQTALVIDHSGCLATITAGAGPKTASAEWLGKPPSDQTDYEARD